MCKKCLKKLKKQYLNTLLLMQIFIYICKQYMSIYITISMFLKNHIPFILKKHLCHVLSFIIKIKDEKRFLASKQSDKMYFERDIISVKRKKKVNELKSFLKM